MVPLSLARWTLAEHARRPGTWAALALLAAAWPAALTFGQLGLTTRDEPVSAHLFEIAFLAALYGVALGVDTLARGSWFLERVDPARRVLAEAAALAGSAALPLAAALLPGVLMAPTAAGVTEVGQAAAVGLMAAHVGAVGLVALRLPGPPSVRALSVPLLAWLLPAALPVSPGVPALAPLTRTLVQLFEASRHGRLRLELSSEMAHRWGALLPISALVGAAWLLAARAPSVHALRNPR